MERCLSNETISAWDLAQVLSYHHDLFRSEVRKLRDIEAYFHAIFPKEKENPFSFPLVSSSKQEKDWISRVMISSHYKKQFASFFLQFLGGHYLEISKEVGSQDVSVVSSCFELSTITAMLTSAFPYVIDMLDYMNFYASAFESNIYGFTFTNKKNTSFCYRDESIRLRFSFLASDSVLVSCKDKTQDKEELLKNTFIPLSTLPHSYSLLVRLNEQVKEMEEQSRANVKTK